MVAVESLLDTSIIVDVLRKYQPARDWLAKHPEPGISHFVWLEVLDGVPNKRAQLEVLQILRHFEKILPIEDDLDWAIQQSIHYKLSHNIGTMDLLIASASHRLQIPLYTTNLKHFSPLLGTLAQKPY